MKQFSIPFFRALLVLLTFISLYSCKVSAIKPSDFSKPETFPKTAVDEIAKKDTLVKLPIITQFYKDPLLHSLVNEAIQNNFDLQLAVQRMAESNAELRFFRGALMPEVQVDGRAGQRRFGRYTIDGVGNYDTQFSTNLSPEQRLPLPNIPDYYTGVSASWEVDVWGKLRNLKKGSLQKYLSQAHTRDAIQTQLVAEVAKRYFQLIILDFEFQILEENKRIREEALEVVKIQKQHGRSNELGIELIQAQLHQVNALYIEAKLRILEIENQINLLLGRFPEEIKRSSITETDLFLNRLNLIIPSFVLENRPDIKAAVHQLHASNANVRAAHAAFYPSFTISAAMGVNAFRSNVLFDTPQSLANEFMSRLTFPLLNRRLLKSQLMQTEAMQRTAYVEYQKTVVNAFTEVYELMQKEWYFNQLKGERKKQIDVLQKSIQTSQLLFLNGRATFLEVVTAQENYLLAQIEWLKAMTSLTHTHIDLFKAIGGGLK